MKEYTVLDDDRPYNRSLAFFLTKRCPLRCAHCCVGSGPEVADPDEDEVIRNATAVVASTQLEHVCITGGEPFLRPALLRRVASMFAAAGKDISIITSAFWAGSANKARVALHRVFSDARPFRLWISLDPFHSAYVGAHHYTNAIIAAAAHGIPVGVTVTYIRDEDEAVAFLQTVVPDVSVRNRIAIVKYQPLFLVGRAQTLRYRDAAATVLPRGVCGSCVGHVNAAGDVTACCSVFDATPDHPLYLGQLSATEVDTLLDRSNRDLLIQAIRVLGPARLAVAAAEYLPPAVFEREYLPHDICAVCDAVMKVPAAVAHLRRQLAGRRLARQVAQLRAVQYGEFDSLMQLSEGEENRWPSRISSS